MTDEQFRRVKRAFIATIEADESEWADLLKQECGDDHGARSEVEALLRVCRSDSLLTGAACGLAGLGGAFGGHTAGDRLGSYRLLERLGAGAFGEVWLAEQENPVRPKVAIKILKAGMDTREVLARFDAERRTLARLDHPNIARVSDAGATPQGRPYFVMEYVPGQPITAHCDASRSSIRVRLSLFILICRGVEHAHQKGVIHRDLKPQNILVTERGGELVPKIIDFGVAKALFGDEAQEVITTETGRGVGTLEYMPPEQTGVGGTDVDVRADVYALGVVLYELLTGTLPLDLGDAPRADLRKRIAIICEREPPRPSARLCALGAQDKNDDRAAPTLAQDSGRKSQWRQVRGDLDWITLKAMEKDRARRYASVSALADDVQRHLAGAPVEAAPPSAVYRLQKFVRRNRVSVLASIAVLAAVGIGLIMAESSARRARSAEAARVRIAAYVSGQKRLLGDMLEAARPSIALGGDTTVLKAVLDGAADGVRNGDLHSIPAEELELRVAIGDTYREIGQGPAAHEMLDGSPALAHKLFGPASKLYADVLEVNSRLLRDDGDFAAALPLARETLAVRRTVFAGDNPEIANAIDQIADLLGGLGRGEAALEQHREALAMRRRLSPGGSRAVAESLTNTGDCLRNLGRLAEAAACHQEALQLYRALPTNESLNIALTSNNFAVCLSDMGRLDEAITLQRDALDTFRRLYPGDYPYLARALGNFAGCLQDAGRVEEALTEYRAALDMAARLWSGDHPTTALCLNNLAFCLDAMGRWGEASEKYEAALAMQRRLYPDGHPRTAMLLNNLAKALESMGRPMEAVCRYGEALAQAAKVLPRDDPRVARMESNLGACLLGLGRMNDAESHLTSAQELLDRAAEAPPAHKRENLERLVRLYETWGASDAAQAAKAATWRARLAALHASASAPSGP